MKTDHYEKEYEIARKKVYRDMADRQNKVNSQTSPKPSPYVYALDHETGDYKEGPVTDGVIWRGPDENGMIQILPEESLRPDDDMAKGGVKFDDGKFRDDLIPPELEEAVATVLAFGARKYAERNWEMGMLWSRPYAAARRHLRNWFHRRDFGKGPGNDKDSGYSDLWHAATNIAFLIAYELRGKGTDDRPVADAVPVGNSK